MTSRDIFGDGHNWSSPPFSNRTGPWMSSTGIAAARCEERGAQLGERLTSFDPTEHDERRMRTRVRRFEVGADESVVAHVDRMQVRREEAACDRDVRDVVAVDDRVDPVVLDPRS